MRKQYHDDMSMDQIMRLWPATIRVVLAHNLLCVGCPIAPFHTAQDAVREHGIRGEEFLAALRAVIEGRGEGAAREASSAPAGLLQAASTDEVRSR